jgi:hypothetical protein
MAASKLLAGKGFLTPLQKSFLSLFTQLADHDQFYLTGGTALAEYYLGHRLSFDLDFFTGIDGLVLPVSFQLEQLGKDHGLNIVVVRRFSTYAEFLVEHPQDNLRVDLALDSPFRFEPPLPSTDGILINNYQDLRVDKLLAFYGRAEPRDAIDLYFILQNETIENILQQAKEKDPGFDLYWFAVALNRCADFPDEAERWPVRMLIPFEPVKLKKYFKELATRVLSDFERDSRSSE